MSASKESEYILMSKARVSVQEIWRKTHINRYVFITTGVSGFSRGATEGLCRGLEGVFEGLAQIRAKPIENPRPQAPGALAVFRTRKLQYNKCKCRISAGSANLRRSCSALITARWRECHSVQDVRSTVHEEL
jgi:hypothetical protein